MIDDTVFAEQVEELRADVRGDVQVGNSFLRVTFKPESGVEVRMELWNMSADVVCDLYVNDRLHVGRGSSVREAYDAAATRHIVVPVWADV